MIAAALEDHLVGGGFDIIGRNLYLLDDLQCWHFQASIGQGFPTNVFIEGTKVAVIPPESLVETSVGEVGDHLRCVTIFDLCQPGSIDAIESTIKSHYPHRGDSSPPRRDRV